MNRLIFIPMKRNILAIVPLGLLLFACSNPSPQNDGDAVITRPADETEGGMSFYLKKMDAGVEFYALGNEPFWSLDFENKKVVRFNTAEGFEMNVPYSPFVEVDGHHLEFVAETEMGSIKVELHRERCEDNMSGTPFSHRVRIFIESKNGGQSYEGCGRFVVTPDLNNSFQLERWNKEDVDGEKIAQGAPVLDFDLATLRVSGHSGCNQINAGFIAEPGVVYFSAMASTMMACEGSMEFEQSYLQALGEGPLSYGVNNGKLVMGNANNKMTYKLVE
jgi:heat shock protein HslJ/uncharacterized membrane protein